jgi:hypothetical protein
MKILYMYGYNTDCGSVGHDGDSEWVALTVFYVSDTGRWELEDATYSAHWNTANDFTVTYSPTDLTYDGPSLRAPFVYVSKNKHANYANPYDCSSFTSGDSCTGNVQQSPIAVYSDRNVGESGHQLHNCVTSQEPTVYYGTECLWSGSDFRGWHLSGSGSSTSYGTVLLHFQVAL